jgi:hypothetical protein
MLRQSRRCEFRKISNKKRPGFPGRFVRSLYVALPARRGRAAVKRAMSDFVRLDGALPVKGSTGVKAGSPAIHGRSGIVWFSELEARHRAYFAAHHFWLFYKRSLSGRSANRCDCKQRCYYQVG